MSPLGAGLRIVLLITAGIFCFPGGADASHTDDHANNVSDATLLTLGSPTSGAIEASGDRDYFRFVVPVASEGHEFSIVMSDVTTAQETDTFILLLDSASTPTVEVPLLASDDCAPPSLLSCIPSWVAPVKGIDTTYYVRVQHYASGVGDYRITVSDLGVYTPPTDDHGDTSGTATALTLATQTDGEIETAGDLDFFSFSATGGHLYDVVTLSLGPGMDSLIFVYDTNGTKPLASNDDCGGLESCLSWIAPSSATYFVAVRHFASGVGTYKVEVTDTGIPTITDDCGNNVSSTCLLTLGVGSGGDLEVSGDRDYYRFVVPVASEGHEFSIVISDPTTATGETDTVIILLDSTSTSIVEAPLSASDDCSPPSLLPCISSWVAPTHGVDTTYYVRVQHYANGKGDYEITVTDLGVYTPPADDHGNTPGTATALTLGSPAGGMLSPVGESDYFTFTVPPGSVGNIFTVVTDDPTPITSTIDPLVEYVTDTDIIVFGADGVTGLASNDDCAATNTVLSCINNWVPAVAGVYYVRVRFFRIGTGDYELTVSDTGSPPTPIPDDHGDASGTATALTLGSPTGGEIETSGDLDYFSFDVPVASEGHEFSFVISDPTTAAAVTDTRIILYGSDGTTPLLSNDDCGASVLSCIPSWVTPSNGSLTTYFVRVQHYANGLGDYEVTVTDEGVFTPTADDHGDASGTATALTLGSPTGGEIETSGDLDYFSFVVPLASEGNSFSIQITDPTPGTGPTDTVVTLYDTDGTTALADNDDCGTSVLSCLDRNIPTAGTYFVRVRHYSNGIGDYALTVTDSGGP